MMLAREPLQYSPDAFRGCIGIVCGVHRQQLDNDVIPATILRDADAIGEGAATLVSVMLVAAIQDVLPILLTSMNMSIFDLFSTSQLSVLCGIVAVVGFNVPIVPCDCYCLGVRESQCR